MSLKLNYFPWKNGQKDRQTQVEISTIHRSRERLGLVDSGETTVEKREDVNNI